MIVFRQQVQQKQCRTLRKLFQGHKTDSILLVTERMNLAIIKFDPELGNPCIVPSKTTKFLF